MISRNNYHDVTLAQQLAQLIEGDGHDLATVTAELNSLIELKQVAAVKAEEAVHHTCACCLEVKPRTAFHVNDQSVTKDGRLDVCGPCVQEQARLNSDRRQLKAWTQTSSGQPQVVVRTVESKIAELTEQAAKHRKRVASNRETHPDVKHRIEAGQAAS